MKVRGKIISFLSLMIFMVSCILLLFLFLSSNRIRRNGDNMLAKLAYNVEERVRGELLALADNIGQYAIALEAEIDRNMHNAANVLYEVDRMMGGNLTLADLERIKQMTGMDDLYLGGVDGVFTVATEPEAIGLSLFDIWDGYRMLVTGEATYLPSDLKVKVETGEIFKFTAISRAAGRGVLESALNAEAIEIHLQTFIDNNPSIRSMNLFDVFLMTLTINHAPGAAPLLIPRAMKFPLTI